MTSSALPTIGTIVVERALDRPDLLAESVHAALTSWDRGAEVSVTEIDPDLADTQALVDAYDLAAGRVRQLRRRGRQARR